MSSNTRDKDIKVPGYVLRRVNYGEADRILNIITPEGKITAMAKGVRKEKSKLAGGVEMFCLAEYNIHFGRGEFGVVTGVKMKKYYDKIVKDLDRLELAAEVLKKISRAAEGAETPGFFDIADQCLGAINGGADLGIVKTWYLLNIKRVSGEEINLYRDASGQKLAEDVKYDWDMTEMAFAKNTEGEYVADDIKLLRLLARGDLAMAQRIKVRGEAVVRALRLAQMVV